MMNEDKDYIRKSVKSQLAWDDRLDGADIQVEVHGDTIRLSGIAPNFNAKLAAEADAEVIAGVMKVENLLEVDHASDEDPIGDLEIENNIKNIFMWNSRLDHKTINAMVEDGEATLKGSVDSYWKKMLAEDLAGSVKGAVKVNNRLAVVPGNDIMDEVIAGDIINALERNRNVNWHSVHIKVQDGYVTISGAVPDLHTRHEVYRTALYTRGVADINDHMEVRASRNK